MHRLCTVYAAFKQKIIAFLNPSLKRFAWYRKLTGGVWYYVRFRMDTDLMFYWTRLPVPLERIMRLEDYRQGMIRHVEFRNDGSFIVPLHEVEAALKKASVKLYGPFGD